MTMSEARNVFLDHAFLVAKHTALIFFNLFELGLEADTSVEGNKYLPDDGFLDYFEGTGLATVPAPIGIGKSSGLGRRICRTTI